MTHRHSDYEEDAFKGFESYIFRFQLRRSNRKAKSSGSKNNTHH